MSADQELVKRQEILDKSQRRQMGVEIRRRWGGSQLDQNSLEIHIVIDINSVKMK